MAVKKLPPAKQYIAINTLSDETIAVGTKADVIESIQVYCEDEGWDKDDIEDNVLVYELGQRIDLDIETQLEISF